MEAKGNHHMMSHIPFSRILCLIDWAKIIIFMVCRKYNKLMKMESLCNKFKDP